ncbi:MAG: hypothetical protein LC800_03020 [Acidobacteria bacterium]|nr:hypothetical protein [Acidobacteriota bacterium]
MNTVHLLERLTLTAALGLVFRDTATGERVGAGLRVEVYRKSIPGARATALPNPSGVYVLHDAPGLGGSRFGAGDDAFWAAQPEQPGYVVEVADGEGRFLPFSFEVELFQRGVYSFDSPLAASSPPEPTTVPLYSAATRKVPPGFAAVRAELWDADADAPAAWAVVEARAAGRLAARGLSDERGGLALLFPYPAPARTVVGSPPGSPPVIGGAPLVEQSWELSLAAGYTGELSRPAAARFPDLRLTLGQLNAPAASLWADRAGGEELSHVALRFGRELILRSESFASLSPPAPQSALLITPAGSPP